MQYYADKQGNIYNINNYKLKPYLHSKGYLCFTEYKGKGQRKNWRVHRYVWIYFNGEIPDGYEIDHINHIKTDNRLENLRLVTSEENNRHRKYCRLSLEKSEQIKKLYETGMYSYKELADEFECSKTTIHNVIKELTWV